LVSQPVSQLVSPLTHSTGQEVHGFYETRRFVACSEKPTNGPYPEPAHSNTDSGIAFLSCVYQPSYRRNCITCAAQIINLHIT